MYVCVDSGMREMLCKEKHQENQISRFPKWYNILFYTRTNCKNSSKQAYINVYVVKLSSIILTKNKTKNINEIIEISLKEWKRLSTERKEDWNMYLTYSHI